MKNDMATAPTAPMVSTAMGMNAYVDSKSKYLEILRLSASQATFEGPRTVAFYFVQKSVFNCERVASTFRC